MPVSPISLNGVLNITSELKVGNKEPTRKTAQMFVTTLITTTETQPNYIKSAYAVQMYPVEAELWSKAKRASIKPLFANQTIQQIPTEGDSMGVATGTLDVIWPLAPNFHPMVFLEANRSARAGHYTFQLDNPIKKESPTLTATLEIREESQNGTMKTFRIVYNVPEQSWDEKNFTASFSTNCEESCTVDTVTGRIMQRTGTLQSEFKTTLGDFRGETITFELYMGD